MRKLVSREKPIIFIIIQFKYELYKNHLAIFHPRMELAMQYVPFYFIIMWIEKNLRYKKEANIMAIHILLPKSLATHAKPVLGTAILCMGHN
jgi:hypothetical protein